MKKNNKTKKIPRAYLITFRLYGSSLHGDPRGSIDRYHNKFGEHFIPEKSIRMQSIKNILKKEACHLNENHRETVMQSIIQTCEYFRWPLIAVHVKSNHVHVILRSNNNVNIILQKNKSLCYS